MIARIVRIEPDSLLRCSQGVLRLIQGYERVGSDPMKRWKPTVQLEATLGGLDCFPWPP